MLGEQSDKSYIFDHDNDVLKNIKKSSINKKILSSSKNTVIDNYKDFTSSEKVELFNQIIKDLKKII